MDPASIRTILGVWLALLRIPAVEPESSPTQGRARLRRANTDHDAVSRVAKNKKNGGNTALTAPGIRLPGWLQRHGVSVLFLVGVCLISLSLSRQIIDFVRLLRSPVPVASEASAAAQQQPISLDHLQGLFGTPVHQQGNQAAPPTNLQLTLLASFVNPDSQRSTAIILVAGGKPKRLTVGDEINSGVRLQAVHQDHVVLSRNGRDESLRFARSRSSQPSTYADPMQPTTEQLEQLQDENVQLLQQHMEELRQQTDDDGSTPPPTEAPEAETNP